MIPICVVDAFTDAAFGGNPAAVCRLDRPADAVWMQHVATEMNLSETAFLVERSDGTLDLRWFTPAAEVALCGHATLASAHVLGGDGAFHTLSGVLTCRKESDGWIEMDFPALPAAPTTYDDALTRALGTTEVYTVGRSRFDLVVELGTAAAVRSLQPDLRAPSPPSTPGRHRHRARRPPRHRLREPLLRPGRRCGRGSGHRFGALRAGPVLGRAPRPARAGGRAGFGSGRHRPHAPRR